MNEHPLRIVLADDHPLVRSGIRATLMEDGEMETVGEASTGDEALRAAQELCPDLLILDLSMPGLAPDQVRSSTLPSKRFGITPVCSIRSWVSPRASRQWFGVASAG